MRETKYIYTQEYTLDIPDGGTFPMSFTILLDPRADPILFQRDGTIGTTAFTQTYNSLREMNSAFRSELDPFQRFARILNQVKGATDYETAVSTTPLSFSDNGGGGPKTGFFKITLDRTVNPATYTVQADFETQGFTKVKNDAQPFILMMRPIQNIHEDFIRALKPIADAEQLIL